jgi:hypothetical protein
MEYNTTDDELKVQLNPRTFESSNDNSRKRPLFKKEFSLNSQSSGKFSWSSKDFNKSNSDRIPKLKMSDPLIDFDDKRNMNRIIIHPDTPQYTFFGDYYNLISCPVITTLMIGRVKHSFLTNPSNDMKNYYLRRKREEDSEDLIDDLKKFYENPTSLKFRRNNWNTEKTNSKIPDEKITEFITQFNNTIDPICFRIENMKKDSEYNKKLFLFAALLSLMMLIISLYAIYCVIYVQTFSLIFLVIFTFFGTFSIVNLILGLIYGYFGKKSELEEYICLLAIIEGFANVEEFIHQWNEEVFLPLGLIISAPKTLNYIHICLDPYNELVIKDHNFPNQVKKIDCVDKV